MMRWLLLILLLLVGGAIVNVAVAWGFCVAGPTATVATLQMAPYGKVDQNIARFFGRDLPLPPDGTIGFISHTPGLTQESYMATPIGLAVRGVGIIDACWPLRSLHAAVVSEGTSRSRRWCIRNPLDASAENALPLRPIWPGFAINTVFYAVVLWLLFAAPFALRRRRRIKRGLCPKCAYPIGSSHVCTECGGALRLSTAEAR